MVTESDGSAGEAPGDRTAIGAPSLKSATARRVRYERPRRFVEQGKERFERDMIEIDVVTDADFAIAGTGPALIVGEITLLESERIGEKRYRFFAPGSLSLQPKASISLGLGGSGTPVAASRSRVRLRWEPDSSR